MINFDPSGVAIKNGNYFGLPYSLEESEVLILPAPWDVTTSYRPGTCNGPKQVLDASTQLDLSSAYVPEAWTKKIGTLPENVAWLKDSIQQRILAEEVIHALEQGQTEEELKSKINHINELGKNFHQAVYKKSIEVLNQNKKLVLLGGDHSTSYGAIKAHDEKYASYSVLHFDAHADLRVNYEGFEHSHASIMNHVKDFKNLKSLVQVGIRDYSPDEASVIRSHPKLKTFFDSDLKKAAYEGVSWKSQCDQIISHLDKNVYISFDIDGLDPKFCPNTGTPVPGGIEFEQAVYLMAQVQASGRRIIGADLVEVFSGEDGEWDANVGARMLFHLCTLICK